jgi:hypothetical protein
MENFETLILDDEFSWQRPGQEKGKVFGGTDDIGDVSDKMFDLGRSIFACLSDCSFATMAQQ